MASTNTKRRTTAVNAPKKVWATNLPGASIELSNLYLWIQLKPKARKMCFHIDGKRLWEQLRGLSEEKASSRVIPVGDLDMRFEGWEGEVVAIIEPPEESKEDFEYQIKVPLRELKNALCTFLKF